MSKFVDAYSKSTGLKQRIPARWVGHPVLGKDFDLTPSARASAATAEGTGDQAAAPVPDATWSLEQLQAYVLEHDVDLDEVDTEDAGEILAAISNHHESR